MMDITRLVRGLKLPADEFMIVGGGIITALQLRELHDIDILVTDKVFEGFMKAGWPVARWSGQIGLRKGMFELGTQVRGYTLMELLDEASYVEGVPYLNLELVYCIKQELRRNTDIRDLQIIESSGFSLCADCMNHARTIVDHMYNV